MDIENVVNNAVDSIFCSDHEPKTEKRGRKNKGLTDSHYEQKKQDYKDFRRIKQGATFLVKKYDCEVVGSGDDIENFKELYRLTCFDCLERFQQDNTELAKKASFLWYKRVLIDIKKSTPKITCNDLDKCVVVWDVLTELMDYIGLYITYETFEKVTSIYKYQIEKKAVLSPKYKDFLQKINIERDSALLNELQYNPYNQTNKIFVAKSHGIVEKTEPKTIEVNHNIRNYDSLPMYKSIENEDHR